MQGAHSAKYWTSQTEKVREIAEEFLKKDFPHLRHIRIKFAWRNPPKYDPKTNMLVRGECHKVPTQWRDIFECDIVIILARKIWKEDLSPRQRRRLVWHEMNHVIVQMDDTMRPVEDDHGRVKISLRKHNTDMHTFMEEIARFGADGEQKVKLKELAILHKKTRKRLSFED